MNASFNTSALQITTICEGLETEVCVPGSGLRAEFGPAELRIWLEPDENDAGQKTLLSAETVRLFPEGICRGSRVFSIGVNGPPSVSRLSPSEHLHTLKLSIQELKASRISAGRRGGIK